MNKMNWFAKRKVNVSIWQIILPKIIAFIFSLMCVGIFFIEGIHIEDNFQPFLAVFIFLFWDFFWLVLILKGFGIRTTN